MLIKNLGREITELIFKILFSIFGKPKMDTITQKTLDLYNKDGEFHKLFSLIRLWDAPFQELDQKIPKTGQIVDLGCGDGIVVNYLALKQKTRKILGIEIDKDRVTEADKKLKNTKFLEGDITKINFPKADAIILTHVLHHLTTKNAQEFLLKKIKTKLKKNGKLVIVEIIEKPFWKYLLTWVTDAFVVPIVFSGKLYDFNFHYRQEKEWTLLLTSLGYKVSSYKADKDKPFSHVIFVCQQSTK